MPLRPRAARAVAVAAVAALSTSALASCATGPGQAAPRSHYSVSRGPQPVAAPHSRDPIDLSHPVPGAAFQAPRQQPNLLMITVDDAAWDDMSYMPHLRHLMVDQGTTLANGMSPTPLCVPARASLLTGQYAHNHGALSISGESGGFSSFADDQNTLPVWLQTAGYDTYFIGKYLNGYGEEGSKRYEPPGWTDWHATVDPSTYQFVDEEVNANGALSWHHEYNTTFLSDAANRELAKAPERHHPWYMWVNYTAPHVGGPWQPDDPQRTHPYDPHPVKTTYPAPRDANTFAGLHLPKKPDMFENPSDKVIIRKTHTKWPKWRRAELREAFQQRVEALQSVDRALARTFRTLRRTHQLHNTYVVVTSDNGYVLGEHNLTGKLWYFREIVGVPMYIRGPGIPRGYRSQTPVTNADWAPTFAALAGAKPGRPEDGVNVLPWLHKKVNARVVPIEAFPVHDRPKHRVRRKYAGVVLGPWTYVRHGRKLAELYYRTVDPWQNHNLRRDPRYRAQVRQLDKLTNRYRNCAGQQCPRKFYWLR